MRFESTPPDLPVRLVRHFDVFPHGDDVVFVIESGDILPENPRFWMEGENGVFHHGPGRIIIFEHIDLETRLHLGKATRIFVEERHEQHFNQGLTPWGMDKITPGLLYEVPIIPIPVDLSLKGAFPVK